MDESAKNEIQEPVQREFTLGLETVEGATTLFIAFVNGVMVISDPADKSRTWTGKIPEGPVKLQVRVTGIDNAKFKLTIDLPGVADDQSLTLQLKGGYYETEITL
jgi:hypothetical protein